MPGAGWSTAKPWHWRVVFRWWLDPWRKFTGGSTTQEWLEWALKHAEPYGMQSEVKDYFHSHVAAGVHPSIAANWALDEWDL